MYKPGVILGESSRAGSGRRRVQQRLAQGAAGSATPTLISSHPPAPPGASPWATACALVCNTILEASFPWILSCSTILESSFPWILSNCFLNLFKLPVLAASCCHQVNCLSGGKGSENRWLYAFPMFLVQFHRSGNTYLFSGISLGLGPLQKTFGALDRPSGFSLILCYFAAHVPIAFL